MGGGGRAGGGRGQRSSCPWSIPAWRLPGPHGLELGHEQDPSPEILVNAGASSGGQHTPLLLWIPISTYIMYPHYTEHCVACIHRIYSHRIYSACIQNISLN